MNKFKYLSILFLGAIVFFSSCDKDFEEINENIDDPISIPSSKLIGTVVKTSSDVLYSTFNGSEIGENWVQHNSLVQYNDPDRYRPRVTSMDGVWNSLFLTASDANQMQQLAIAEGNDINQGVALVLKSYCLLVLTDLYGDIPYTEALLGPSESIFTPVYDPQETVYNGVLAELDEAVAFLSSGNGTIDPNMDILYAGDAGGWLKFANSLKFRALMRISGKKDVSVDLQALVDGGGLFASNADEAKLVYLSASPDANPVHEQVVGASRSEHRLSATFIDKLLEFNDPRLSIYAEPTADGSYAGKPNGYTESPLPGYSVETVSGIGAKYLEAEAPGYFVSYTELLFLMAEAALKGFISGDAKAYYDAAVTNSFAENGASGVEAYLTSAGVVFNADNGMEQIGTQKWISLFGQGFEAWTEWRRTRFPVLSPATEGFIDEIPSRLKYETSDVSINAANYNAAVARQGADELTTPVWWMN